jgi:ferric-dicitrate binding protein FerR (iron transport regulator)
MNTNESERSVERLMKLAGPRELPSVEATERARVAAHESWQHMLEEEARPAPRRRLKVVFALAAAAGIAAVAFVSLRLAQTGAPLPVAHVATIEGPAVVHTDKGDSVVFVADRVFANSTLTTGQGRIALTFGDSLSLRMDRGTRLRFDAVDRVTLLAGTVYVDSGGVNASTRLRVQTPVGEVRHVGTQFQVHVDGENTTVLVREGRVLFKPSEAGDQRDISAGDELRIEDGRTDFRHGLPSFGTEWEWTSAVAPRFDIESRPLAEFIAWISREHGWQVRYASEVLQQQTYEIRLHGALETASGAAMVERMSLITGVPLEARDGVLWVGLPEERR